MGTDEGDILKAMLMAVVLSLVDNEKAVSISTTKSTSPSGETTLFSFEIDADKEDVGKLIGRSGKTAGAMRHVLSAASAKLKVRSILSIPDKRSE